MQPKYPRVFIIILTWNSNPDTLECLASLEQADYSNYRTVLVDNGSTDGTVATVREQFPSVLTIENGRNLGYAEGNNIGIRYALEHAADFILILNNDTVVAADLLQHLVSAALQYPGAGIFSPKIYMYYPPSVVWFAGTKWDSSTAKFLSPGSGEREKSSESECYSTDYASGCALFARVEIARTIGLFDERFFLVWEEADWCYRARRAGYEILVQPQAKVRHKVSRTFMDSNSGIDYQYYFSRNRWLWIERNLKGTARLKAFQRCLRETYWCMLELAKRDLSASERNILQARLVGTRHYFLRRFGHGPSFTKIDSRDTRKAIVT